MNILPLLVERGMISESDTATLQKEMQDKGITLEEALKSRGIDTSAVLAVQGEYLGVPTKAVTNTESIGSDVLQFIPEESAQHYGMVPLGIIDGVLEVGMLDPDNIEAVDALNFISARQNTPYKTFLISQEDFAKVLNMYQGIGGAVNRALTAIDEESDENKPTVDLGGGAAPVVSGTNESSEGDESVSDSAPVTKIVATMVRNAVEGRASDIHIENDGEKVRVRFRVDGTLHTSIILPSKVHRAVVSRIKILSSLKLDERRKPQDGRFSATIEDRKVDFRVSTFPTRFGEKVVMRILDTKKNVSRLEDIGMSKAHLEMVRRAVNKPYGMILVTGPTGSGKSTTLRAMLLEVDSEKKNVLSLEDPVEYDIPGVSQSQMRPDIGYTFASGLRSVLRQDPDIIMVGEIRDKETAQLAVQAALTGHLVFSTLHTNTALGAIPRLVDMGVDQYLLAPTLELVVGQRLVRSMCEGSGRKIPVEGTVKQMIDDQFSDLPQQYKEQLPLDQGYIWGLEPTGDCPSGTRGRTGVHEMIEVTRPFEDAILNGADDNKLYDLARAQGFLTMREEGIIKAFNREVPLEEVNTLGGAFGSVEQDENEVLNEIAPDTTASDSQITV